MLDGTVVVLVITGEIVVVRLLIMDTTKNEPNDTFFFSVSYELNKIKSKTFNLLSLSALLISYYY
jgi:hypothetical protein